MKNIRKRFIYEGLGFPVELSNVEMIDFHGELMPVIDVRKVAKQCFNTLLLRVKNGDILSREEKKFVLIYFDTYEKYQ